MIYQVLDDDGHALDAHLEIEGKDIVFHSRGGVGAGRKPQLNW